MNKIPRLKCFKCGHGWYPRSDQQPKVCPRCKCYGWDKPPQEVQSEVVVKK